MSITKEVTPSFDPEELTARMLRSARREALDLSPKKLVKVTAPQNGHTVPLLIAPAFEGISLAGWVAKNKGMIETELRRCGGILFRGFGINGHERLEEFLSAVDLRRMPYMEGATPRTELGRSVYTSTEYPPEESIALHNELNYVMSWPMRIFFCCEVAAEQQGETPIADVRRVWQRLRPAVQEEFRRKGWMLVRNFGDGMSLAWQTAFRLEAEAELEAYCRGARVEWEWKGEGRLRTWQVRPAVRRHPVSGEEVWFNHVAFWHVSSLRAEVRELFLNEFPQEDLPYNTYYGDGSAIADEVVAEIRAAYEAETVAFRWERGDLLMLDNMLVAHGRRPYGGQRRILVAMGEPYSDMTN
jgi:alpha-ketoglutarate-dependent taurine dioxygenase